MSMKKRAFDVQIASKKKNCMKLASWLYAVVFFVVGGLASPVWAATVSCPGGPVKACCMPMAGQGVEP